MRHDPFLVTGHKVLRRPILVIRDCRPCSTAGVLLVLHHHVHKLLVLRNAAAGRLDRRDYALGIVHHPMVMIREMAALAASAHQPRIRIGCANGHIIHRLETRPVGGVVELLLRCLIGGRVSRDQFAVNS